MMMWTVWLGTVAASFGILEGYSMYTGQPTLSEFIRTTVTNMWPGFQFGFGVATTLLVEHLWNSR